MSCYQNNFDFVSRTKNFVENHCVKESENPEKLVVYEKTLFVNCCVGLLIFSQSVLKSKSQVDELGKINIEDWGIDSSMINANEGISYNYDGANVDLETDDVENIARHIRNSIAHNGFDIFECNKDKNCIEKIKIIDYKDKSHTQKTFDCTLDFVNFQKFVLKYADETLRILP